MIKLTPPIKSHNVALKTAKCDAFARSIMANYDQIGTALGPKDLVHLVTEPPEIFYAEGDATSIFNQNVDIKNINEKKIETINNLINRITLTDSSRLTYQDNVYISSTLRKLGIRNEAEFLSNIYKNLEETNNLSKTVNSLNSVTELIRKAYNTETNSLNEGDENLIFSTLHKLGITDTDTFIQRVTNRIDETHDNRRSVSDIRNVDLTHVDHNVVDEGETTELTDTEIINNLMSRNEFAPKLYQQILQRVGVNENIDILSQQTRNTFTNENITASEMAFTAYNRQINENNLTEAKAAGTVPITLNYREQNTYEAQSNLTELTEETMTSQLTQAVLYSIIENVNHARINRGDTWSEKWINVENAFYNSADNSISRFEENLTNPIDVKYYQQQRDQEIIDEITQMEINNQERVKLYRETQLAQLASDRKIRDLSRRADERDARQDSIMALTNPEEFRAKLEREREEARQIAQRQMDARAEQMPPQIKARMELLQAIVKQGNGVELDQQDAEAITQVLQQIRDERRSNVQIDDSQSIEALTRVENTIQNNEIKQTILPENGADQTAPKATEESNDIGQQFFTDGFHFNTVENVLNADEEPEAEEEEMPEIRWPESGRHQTAPGPQEEPEDIGQQFFTDGFHINRVEHVLNDEEEWETEEEIRQARRSGDYDATELQQTDIDGRGLEILQEQIHQYNINETVNVTNQNIDVTHEDVINKIIHHKHTASHAEQARRPKKDTQHYKQMNFTHKEVESLSSEEIAEILKETKQMLEETRSVQVEHHTQENVSMTEEKTRNIVKNEIENFNIEQQIQSTVHRQLNDFEGTMFTRLESKLDSERQRRGIF